MKDGSNNQLGWGEKREIKRKDVNLDVNETFTWFGSMQMRME